MERLRAGWASSLPTGVLTFCLTDIVDSTVMWGEQPEAMARALVLHDKTIATAVERQGGRLIAAMGDGDSTVSVFDSPTERGRRGHRPDPRPGRGSLAVRTDHDGTCGATHRRSRVPRRQTTSASHSAPRHVSAPWPTAARSSYRKKPPRWSAIIYLRVSRWSTSDRCASADAPAKRGSTPSRRKASTPRPPPNARTRTTRVRPRGRGPLLRTRHGDRRSHRTTRLPLVRARRPLRKRQVLAAAGWRRPPMARRRRRRHPRCLSSAGGHGGWRQPTDC